MDFCCEVLDSEIQQGVPWWQAELYASCKMLAEVLGGDGAGAFTIYIVHTCHLWKGLELGKCDLC